VADVVDLLEGIAADRPYEAGVAILVLLWLVGRGLLARHGRGRY